MSLWPSRARTCSRSCCCSRTSIATTDHCRLRGGELAYHDRQSSERRLSVWSQRQRGDEFGDARQIVEPVDELLHARDGAMAEHHARQLTKLHPKLVFAIRLLEVAARAFPQPCDLTPVSEGDGHARGLQARHARVERGILANRDSPANGRDRGIADRLVGERVIPRVPSNDQRRRRVRERV